jgi:hypothetical protein
MPPLALTDSELEIVSTMAAPLPPSQRAAFLQALADALARYAAEVRGPGLVHRVGRDVQYGFVKGRLDRAGGTCRRRAFSDRGARGRGWPHLRREAIDPAGFGHLAILLPRLRAVAGEGAGDRAAQLLATKNPDQLRAARQGAPYSSHSRSLVIVGSAMACAAWRGRA